MEYQTFNVLKLMYRIKMSLKFLYANESCNVNPKMILFLIENFILICKRITYISRIK